MMLAILYNAWTFFCSQAYSLLVTTASSKMIVAVLVLFLTAAVSAIVYHYYFRSTDGKRLPPGPLNWPYVGCLPLLFWRNVHKTFYRYGKIYGPVFSVYRLGRPIVVLTDYALIKRALIKHGEHFTRIYDDSLAFRLLHLKQGGILEF